jgi:hypothetical protein
VKRNAYDKAFEAIKPLIWARSNRQCEAATFVANILPRNEEDRTEEMVNAVLDFLMVECGGVAVHVHHRKYRNTSRGGTNHPVNLLALCNAHHAWVHAHGGFGQPANLLRLALSAGELEEL